MGAASAQITVLYFGAARERAGVDREVIPVATPTTARGLVDLLVAAHPGLQPLLPYLRIAVDQEFVGLDHPITGDAEVAMIPPVAGGSGAPAPNPRFKIVDRSLSLDEVVAQVQAVDRGGVVTFTGAVRDNTRGRKVLKLVYEAYAPMAERKLAEIAAEAERRWPSARLAIIHRVGTLLPGDLAVVIAAAAAHRDEAFEACRHAIERLKQDVPIWKKEHFEDGEVWVGLGP